ncbi:MAG: hypothetical protein KDG54_13620 [Geminicoccaceae bacterium]|nr:hypothetical protein [Geminicoccaceae bacterium]
MRLISLLIGSVLVLGVPDNARSDAISAHSRNDEKALFENFHDTKSASHDGSPVTATYARPRNSGKPARARMQLAMNDHAGWQQTDAQTFRMAPGRRMDGQSLSLSGLAGLDGLDRDRVVERVEISYSGGRDDASFGLMIGQSPIGRVPLRRNARHASLVVPAGISVGASLGALRLAFEGSIFVDGVTVHLRSIHEPRRTIVIHRPRHDNRRFERRDGHRDHDRGSYQRRHDDDRRRYQSDRRDRDRDRDRDRGSDRTRQRVRDHDRGTGQGRRSDIRSARPGAGGGNGSFPRHH